MIRLLILAILLLASNVFARDPAQVRLFKQTHACPATHKIQHSCPGYVVDHIKPLDCGGLDALSNMQWQTIAEGHAKDKWERNGAECKHRTNNRHP